MSLLARGLRRRQSGGVAIDVSTVFSTTLYTGTGVTQTITNGIDLSGQGGLVWVKRRTGGSGDFSDNLLVDSVRGQSNLLRSNLTNANYDFSLDSLNFSSSGFSAPGGSILYTESGVSYVSWTFRKAERFFDVVTYTGNGANSNRSIQHNLGVQPGCIILKRCDSGGVWYVWNRAFNSGQNLQLETTGGGPYGNGYFSPLPSATDFTLGGLFDSGYPANITNATYVAYLFAHDPDGIIQCGSYTGNNSSTGPTISFGWEPQYLLIKNSSGTGDWLIYDNQRDASNPRTYTIKANTSGAEVTTGLDVDFTSTGFQIKATDSNINTNAATYIYMAIKKAT